MRTGDMEPMGGSKSAQAINYQYRGSTEIMTRRGGIFWGFVLLFLGFVFLAGNFKIITLDWGLVFPLLVIIAGLYLLSSKLLH